MAYQFKTTEERSRLMSKIRSNNTKPEVLFRKKLWGSSIRFSRKESTMPEKPDIVLNKHKIAIFIDGEFWHGYRWEEKKKKLKANRGYWIPKIGKNILRDRQNNRKLKKAGWKVVRFWEHQINKDTEKCLQKIKKIANENSK
ncbi:MAG: very short patch repair endonuclease [Candidatus Omnitrophota bacterium]